MREGRLTEWLRTKRDLCALDTVDYNFCVSLFGSATTTNDEWHKNFWQYMKFQMQRWAFAAYTVNREVFQLKDHCLRGDR